MKKSNTLFSAVIALSAAVSSIFATTNYVVAADLGGQNFSADSVLKSTWHPFSACHGSVGASFAYGRLQTGWTDVATGGTSSMPLASDGVLTQIGGGCDIHFGRMVIGGMAQYSFGSVSTRIGDTSIDISNQWGVGGRLGYLVSPNWLLYGKVGLARGDAKVSTTEMSATTNAMRGYNVGLGSEYKISAPIWLRLEAAATRYGSFTVNDVTINPTVYTGTAAIVFKF